MNGWMSTGWQQGMLLCVFAIVSLRCEDEVAAPGSCDYLFLVQSISSRQSILEGDPQHVPTLVCVPMPIPGVAFDPRTKSLKIFRGPSFAIDAELQSIIWLMSNGLSPSRMGGCGWDYALPVAHIPAQIDSSVVFASIEAGGAADLVVKGQLVKIEVDSDYQTYLRTQRGGGYYWIPPDTTRYRFVIEQVDSLRIHNYGWCPKRLVSFEGSYYGLKQ
jgi:hypothetical protein